MLRDGKIQLGEFNLCVAADKPPAAYSQLSSDVALPNLKWIDGHKPVFKVNVSMVSSIHPKVCDSVSSYWACAQCVSSYVQDTHLLDFMLAYYRHSTRLADEKDLSLSIGKLRGANPDSLVHFLHITLSNLCSLLVRPSTTEDSIDVPSKAFEALASIIQRVSNLDLPTDKHGRNLILASYVQYVFDAPQGMASSSFEAKTSTLTKARTSSTGAGEDDFSPVQAAAAAAFKKGGSVRGTKGISFNGECATLC